MTALLDAIAPPRMGRSFRRWLVASVAGNAGDGIALAAGPLLVAAQTKDPLVVALATLLQQLPWLLFGLHAGALADRVDRRRLMTVVNLARTAVLLVLVATIAIGLVNVPIVLATLFLLGSAEVVADTTGQTLLPMIVDRDDLGIGNARQTFVHLTLNRLAVPPVGALLFTVGMAVPFAAQAVCTALAAVLITRIAIDRPAPAGHDRSARGDIVAGVRWLWGHPVVRILTLTVVAFNITFGAVWAILVLYATERLGLGEIGFGVLMTVGAAGGILGTLLYGRLERSIGRGWIMRIGLVIETTTHLVLALTTRPAIAMVMFFVFGMHEAWWGTTAATVRQRSVPIELQGRVGSAYLVGVFGSLVGGAALGGVIAGRWGLTGPFWFGFVGSVLILTVMWPKFSALAHDV